MAKPRWQIQEHVVAALEQHLNQRARVRPNVKLPVLEDPEREPRQCDVVIEEGEEPRITRTIVEVQKRKRKPTVAEFDGWYTKMREVGAQHLLCVSEVGFPSSIERKAERIGPTVRLLTLSQVEDDGSLLPSLIASPRMRVVQYEQLTGLRLEHEHVVRQDPSGELPSPFAKVFRVAGERPISVTDLMDQHLFGNPGNLETLPSNGSVITLGVDFKQLTNLEHLTVDGKWVRLKSLKIAMRLSVAETEIEWEDAKYDQLGFGDMGWALKGTAIVAGDKVEMVAPLKHLGPGQYVIGRPITLSNHDLFVSIGGRGYQSQSIDS